MPVIDRPGKPALHYTVDDYTDPWKNAQFVVLQHGNGRSSRFWYSWVPYLARHYRVVRPDARGLGSSSAQFDLEREVTVEALSAISSQSSMRSAPTRSISAANRWAVSWDLRSRRCTRSGCAR
jgi:pimeloyl-ACP methyl ester carboxylesterase